MRDEQGKPITGGLVVSMGMGVMINALFGDGGLTASAIERAAGGTIVSARVDDHAKEDGAVVLTFGDGTLTLFDDGRSCCESRYLTCDDNINDLVGDTLVSIEERDGHESEDPGSDYEHEVCFVVITTNKGAATVATHNEHNGYYGGFWLKAEWAPASAPTP